MVASTPTRRMISRANSNQVAAPVRLSLLNNQLQGAYMIFDMEPVTQILAVA